LSLPSRLQGLESVLSEAQLFVFFCFRDAIIRILERNKYECTMDQELYTKLLAGGRRPLLHTAGQQQRTLRVHSPDGSIFLREMTSLSSGKYDVTSEIRIRRWMLIYLKNNPAEFHPDPI